jgi:hypothetical protein
MRFFRGRSPSDLFLGLALLQAGLLLGQLLPPRHGTADAAGAGPTVPRDTPVTLTGQLTTSSLTTLYTVPADRMLIIADISVNGMVVNTGDLFRLYDATRGAYLWTGAWNSVTTLSYNAGYQPSSATAHFSPGLAIPPKTVLQANSYYGTYGSTKVTNVYTISGYLTRP